MSYPRNGGHYLTGDYSSPWMAAQDYAARGFAVFPLHTPLPGGKCSCGKECGRDRGKHPRTRNGRNDATTDQQQIYQWWCRQWPDANVGIATGPESGFWALDVEEEGKDCNADLISKLPETVVVTTGGGGNHYFFRYPKGRKVPNRPVPGRTKIDTRGEGGYICAPPSLHRSGNRYEFDGLYAVDVHEITEAPEWLLDVVCATASPAGKTERSNADSFPPADPEKVITGCAWLRNTVVEAKTLSEPAWYAQMGIAARLEGGERIGHEWSKPHPDYVPEKTQAKMLHAYRDAGPPKCERIRSDLGGEPFCSQCPSWGKIKSPITLGDAPRLVFHAGSAARQQSQGSATPEPPPLSREEAEEKLVALLAVAKDDPPKALASENAALLALLKESHAELFARAHRELKEAGVPLDLLRAEVGKATKASKAGRQPSPTEADPGKDGAAKAIFEMYLEESSELFRDVNGEGYVTVKNGNRKETFALGSRLSKGWVGNTFYARFGNIPSAQAISDANNGLLGWIHAQNEPAQQVFTRVGRHGDALYFNLADDEGHAVKITADGWDIVNDSPARFLRTKGTLPLPLPLRGGSVEDLRPFLNISDEKDGDFRLIVCWLVAALRPEGPFPLLELTGGPGTAKSTQARVLQRLIDPQSGDLRSEPKETRDLAIAAQNGWVMAYDNLRHFEPWLSDTLCRISTGGGFATRKLHTDSEEAIFSFQRPALWTGISPVAAAADLIDRAIAIALAPLLNRRPENEFWAEFYQQRPLILGALLDVVAGAMRELPNVKLQNPPRLADFTYWATAAERALGWEEGAFLDAYTEVRNDAHVTAFEACVIAAPLLRFLEGVPGRCWEGSSEALLHALQTAESHRRSAKMLSGESVPVPQNWPKNGRGMTSALQRNQPTLREAGITCEQGQRTRTSRVWKIRYDPDSETLNPGDGWGDGRPESGDGPTANRHQPSPDSTHGGDGGDGGDGLTPLFLHAENRTLSQGNTGGNGGKWYGNGQREHTQYPEHVNRAGKPSPPSPPSPDGECPLCGAHGDHDCQQEIAEMLV